MAERYKDKAEFILVYIREAHPTDGWQVPINERERILLPTAKDIEEKEDHASMCVLGLDIKFTTLIDNMDNAVEKNYSAWPDRLYLVSKEGRIAWKGQPGPGGFRPSELETAVRPELSR